MKVIDWNIKFSEWKGVQMRLYVKAAPTGGGTPSRVFELTPDEAQSLAHDLMYFDMEASK